jgi:predicted deacetylase
MLAVTTDIVRYVPMKRVLLCVLCIALLAACAPVPPAVDVEATPAVITADGPYETAPEPAATPEPEPVFAPEELVMTVRNEDGDVLDILTLTIDGALPRVPLDAVYRTGRLYFDFPDTTAEPRQSDGLSLFEHCEENGLFADFDYAGNAIRLFTGHVRPEQFSPAGERNALLRLEDIAAVGPEYAELDQLIKMRAMGDLLHQHGAAFSIAWIPLYVRPRDDFRNDVTADYSLYNIEFVFTMDYWLSRGGIVNLHGYTHQHGNGNSIDGVEFGPGVNESEAATRERYELAIAAAEALGWTPDSFTYPKYAATRRQYEILEEYFDIIYTRPFQRWPNSPFYTERDGRSIVYLHTPQDHVVSRWEDAVSAMLGRIRNAGAFCSFFFHPRLDFDFIHIERNESTLPVITYSADSPLQRILSVLTETGRVLRPPSVYLKTE